MLQIDYAFFVTYLNGEWSGWVPLSQLYRNAITRELPVNFFLTIFPAAERPYWIRWLFYIQKVIWSTQDSAFYKWFLQIAQITGAL